MVQFFYALMRVVNSTVLLRLLNKLANIIVPFWYCVTFTPRISQKDIKPKLVVSLTSFPKRICTIHLVIESILRQSLRPNKVLLYLSKEQFGDTVDESNLPKRLLALQKKGLEIIMVDGDLRSYKKFYYAFKDYPDSLVVTVDDDIIYNTDLIRTLFEAKGENNVTANLARIIAKDKSGNLMPYSEWKLDDNPVNNHIIIGAGGAMYSPRLMYKDVLNVELFMNLAPKADDMWLSAMARLNNIRILPTGYANKFIAISIKHNESLYSENASQNDVQIQSINEFFKSNSGIEPLK